MPPETPNSYDTVPFQGCCFPRSQPLHLATLGTLLGMQPVDVEQCRVLELGCAEGANLIPIAARYPGSRFVGLDASGRQIEAGQRIIDRLGLSNIELIRGDILQAGASLGSFDYIMAHGVFSWVPENVRDKILEICGTSLSPAGIAYISYNTNPGGHMRNMVRAMLSYHVRRITDPLQRVAQARQFLDFLIASTGSQNSMYRRLLEWERNHIAPYPDHQVRHDLLADEFAAHGVSEIIERAGRAGLQYLGEADLRVMFSAAATAAARDAVSRISSNLTDYEQYLDFFLNRTFRETVLCRSEHKLIRRIDPLCITRFYMSSPVKPHSPEPDIGGTRRETFGQADRGELAAEAPLIKAALLVLGRAWPQNIDFPTLVERARATVREAKHGSSSMMVDDSQTAALIDAIWQGVMHGLVELSLRPSACVAHVSPLPAAARIVRCQAELGTVATNERHENVRLDPLQRQLLPHLDGSRDRQTLVRILAETDADAEKRGQEIGDAAALLERVEAGLTQLANAALLTG